MRATFLTALGAAVLVTIPRAFEEPRSAIVWLVVLGLAAVGHLRGPEALARVATPVAGVLWLQVAFFPLPPGQWMFGLVLGAIGSLVALGMALVYRANKVLNFAQAELGTAPAVLVVGLVTVWGWPWGWSVLLGLAAAVVLGAVVELAIIRRFTRAPRLILTVATIGLSQLLTFGSILLPRLFDVNILDQGLDVPWTVRISDGPPALTGDHLLALVAVPVIIGALAAFIRFTDVGVAIRAASESGDRAALLGIPVRRLQTAVWVIATVLSFVGVLLRASVISLPVAATLSFGILLTALAALVLGNLTDLVAVAGSAVAVGILEQGVLYNAADEMVAPVLGGVIVVVMLFRRLGSSRAAADGTASWLAADEVRPIPAELRRLPEIRALRAGALGLAAVVVLGFPLVVGSSDQVKGVFVACFVLVAVSIVVLTGWSGQVSLGQMSFVAVGAVVGAQSSGEWRLDLSLALLLAGLAGAVVAVVVGLPALRLKGPLLGVTTLAFAVASTQFLLNRSRNSFLPDERFDRPRLFALVDIDSQRSLYYVCVAVAVLGIVAVHGVRRQPHRPGPPRPARQRAGGGGLRHPRAAGEADRLRPLGVRSPPSPAACYAQGVNGTYSEQPFVAGREPRRLHRGSVVGGLGSTGRGRASAPCSSTAGRYYLSTHRGTCSPSAVGVLLVLTVIPGGLADLLYRGRDAVLRRVARKRRGLVVPSLVADVRTDDDAPDGHRRRAARSTAGPRRVDGRRDGGGAVSDRHRRGGHPARRRTRRAGRLAPGLVARLGWARPAGTPLAVLFGLNLDRRARPLRLLPPASPTSATRFRPQQRRRPQRGRPRHRRAPSCSRSPIAHLGRPSRPGGASHCSAPWRGPPSR
jgi:branched-chain amino acid transport system permease protein